MSLEAEMAREQEDGTEREGARLEDFWRDLDERIFRGDPVPSLLEFAVERLVSALDLPVVWVGLAEEDGRVVDWAVSGPERGYVDEIDVRWDESSAGGGPTGRAVRENQPVVADIGTDPMFAPWREQALRHGLRSSLAVPMPGRAEPIGAVNFYATSESYFDRDKIRRLQEIGGHLGLAIERSRILDELIEERRRLRRAERIGRMGHWEWVPETGKVVWSEQFCRLLGYDDDRVEPSYELFLDHLHPDDRDRVSRAVERALDTGAASGLDFRIIRADGSTRWWEDRWTIEQQGDDVRLHGIARDITERKRAEEKLEFQARHDPLTGLANRRVLREELDEACALAERDRPSALLFTDVDNFKLVNDEAGHVAGDRFLTEFASLLRELVRPTDVVVRMGGDEFAVLLHGADRRRGRNAAERLRRAALDYEFVQDDFRFGPTLSIGAVQIDGSVEGERPGDVYLGRAEVAMEACKERGKNRVLYHREEWGDAREEGQASRWLSRLRTAIRQDRFEVFLQPIRFLDGEDSPPAYEALIRLREGDRLLPPAAFLPYAERFGLIVEVDRWMVEAGLELLDRAPDGTMVAVNVSGNTTGTGVFTEHLSELAAERGGGLRGLVLEVTETAAVQNLGRARKWMEEIGELGVRFALDDFGTGFASFSYLRTLPVDFVKIGGKIVQDVKRDSSQQAIVRAMVDVSHSLGHQVVAEWVEDDETLELVRSYGVDAVQGFGVGEPRPAGDVLPG